MTAMASVLALTAVPARAASFAEFDRRADAGERLTVVYFGASLTWGANATDPNRSSWRALVSRKLEERYPRAHFRFVDAAIGGTGSQLGVFRFERDVVAYRPDLVFLDFTANDTITTADKPSLASYEAIVRRVVAEAGAPLVQVVLPFKWDLKTPREQLARLAAHRQLSEAYGAAFADAVSLLKDRMKSGAVNPDDLWPADPVHPGDAGYAQFAEAVWSAFDQAVAEKRVGRPPAEPLHGDLFLHSKRARLADLGPLPAGWRRDRPHVQASNYDMMMSRWLDSVAVAGGSTNVAPLRLEFRGRFVMLFGEGTVKTGKLRALLDGQPVTYMVKKQPETLFDPGSLAHKIKGTTHLVQTLIGDAAPDTYHTLELIPVLASPDEELRLESLCVAGPGADVRLPKP
jgi:lysophospholipase L1-like esterase